MAELRVRQEPLRAWPQLVLLGVGGAVAAALLTAAVAPPPAERLPPGQAAAFVLVELLAVGVGAVSYHLAPRRLGYRLRGRRLEVRTLLGSWQLPAASVRGAERIDVRLFVLPGARLGWPHSHLPGYYVGVFRAAGVGRVRAFAGARRGHGVLLRTDRGEPVLLTPRDPDALIDWLTRHGGPPRGGR